MRPSLCALCLALAWGCLAPLDENISLPPGPDGGDNGGGGGGGDGGGIVIIPPPPPPPTNVCGRGAVVDPGGHGGFPGSGMGSDGGTGQLWLVRIDRGTANLADAIQTLISQTTAALRTAGLSPRGIAVLSLYQGNQGNLVWATTDARAASLTTIATALRSRAALDNPSPAGCATSSLLNAGGQLPGIGAPASAPFGIRPGALLVGIVDHGARPAPLASCGIPAAVLGADPACWALFAGTVLHRASFRFAFFATPESGTTAAMRTSCLAVPGFPAGTLDALESSDLPFYDPLAQGIDEGQPDLATRFDLCQAIGTDAPRQLAALANAWGQLLAAQP